MAKFLLLYSGGNPPKDAEEGQKVMQAWMAWFGKLGPRIVDGGAPLGPRETVHGGAHSGATGYSIVDAESLEDAVKLTDGHPHTLSGGGIEILEVMPIPT